MSEKSTSDYKVVIFTFPYFGHMNPTSAIIRALANARRHARSVQVIVYTSDKYKRLVENAGGLYRAYPHFYDQPTAEMRSPDTGEYIISMHFVHLLGCADANADELVALVRDEQPDLIMYDETAYFPVYALAKLQQDYESGRSTYKPPPNAMFATTFPIWQRDIYPNKVEAVLESWSMEGMEKIQEMHATLCKRLELSEHLQQMDVSDFYYIFIKDNLSIELMPRYHLYDSKLVKFVGICLSEEARGEGQQQQQKSLVSHGNAKLQSFIDMFEPINPRQLVSHQINSDDDNATLELSALSIEDRQALADSSRPKLIYISLGTVFNDRISVFEYIISELAQLEPERHNVRIILSASDTLDSINQLVAQGKITIPDFMVVDNYVPQIEILKRASLFVSHCGMNSASEAIHFGVPLVCVPQDFDQMRVAYRVSDELGVGVRLVHRNGWLEKGALLNAVKKMLDTAAATGGDGEGEGLAYLKRMLTLSKLSRQYNGGRRAAVAILDAIDRSRV